MSNSPPRSPQIGERPAVGRPAVPVRRAGRGDQRGLASGHRQRVDERLVPALRLVADRQQLAVGREPVVVVATGGEAGIDHLGCTAGRGDPVDPAVAVVDQRLAVVQPVGRLDPRRDDVHHAAIRRGERHRLERAVEDGLIPLQGNVRVQLDLRENRPLGGLGVVRADADPDVERRPEFDPYCRAGELHAVAGVDEKADVIFLLLEPDPPGRRDVRLDLVREVALGVAELQRGQAVAVERGVDIRRVGIEVLAE